jgi:hypothetical protein
VWARTADRRAHLALPCGVAQRQAEPEVARLALSLPQRMQPLRGGAHGTHKQTHKQAWRSGARWRRRLAGWLRAPAWVLRQLGCLAARAAESGATTGTVCGLYIAYISAA